MRGILAGAAAPCNADLPAWWLQADPSRATTPGVSKQGRDQDFGAAWDAMRADDAIQFQPVPLPDTPTPDPPPDWLLRALGWLADLLSPVASALASNWFWLKWAGLALFVALMLYGLWRVIDPATLRLRGRRLAAEDELQVNTAAALQLLEDADRLAAEGRFDEATHLLLQRSVGQIADLRPDLIEPSTTAREIAGLTALPDRARTAFAAIATRVEASLFALTPLNATDWQAARAAYADFALGYRGVGA